MGSFSFSGGNARKLVRIPLYLLGRLATRLIRRGDTWVFGCGAGVGDGPLALWREARAHGVTGVWLIDDERDRRDAAEAGIPTLAKHSLRGFLATARAGVIVVSHGFGDVNRYAVTGGLVVQLWHGIPLKRIGLDSPETVRFRFLPRSAVIPRLLAAFYRTTQAGISVLPAASHLVRGRLESAFGLDDARVIVTGEPRVDVLSQGDPHTRRETARAGIREAVGETSGSLVLYAPTWRDGEDDPAVPDASQWRRIVDTLAADDATLLIRSHPLGSGAYVPPFETDRVRMLTSDMVRDVTPLLPGLDVLITDYSSLIYDVGLIPLPTLVFAPDAEGYAARRGFYGRYRDVAGEDFATDWASVCSQLHELLADPDVRERRTERSRRLSDRVHAFRDGRNTSRVYRAIERRLERARRKGRS